MKLKELHEATLSHDRLAEYYLNSYLISHAAAIIELQEAAKVMRFFQRGDGPYDYQAQCDAEDRFDAALAKLEE
jgi:hypothetical protein